ncbi:MAG: four helix bundle protein [Firmicutes bacterium]|nr:four helix bundle protein [Bacillota bacterium]MDY5335951.1 four helix bundle protein [Bacilli bacterium]
MNDFMIVKNIKLFIYNLDNIVVNIPNRDKLIKDRLYNTSYEVLHLVYRCNYNSNKKEEYYKDILSNISMLDFYLERCLKNKYISSRSCEKLSKDLLKITKMIYGWIKSESKC